MRTTRIVPVFIPPRSCVSTCIACHILHGRAPAALWSSRPVEAFERAVMRRWNRSTAVEIGLYGNLLSLAPDAVGAILRRISELVEGSERAKALRVVLRPDQIDPALLDTLRIVDELRVELDVAGPAEAVVRRMGPVHRIEHLWQAATLLKREGIEWGAHIRPGLPHSSPDADMESLDILRALKPAFVRILPTLVLRGTWLEREMIEGRFIPLTIRQAVNLCADMMNRLDEDGIAVARVGLQPVRDFGVEADAVVGGPLHPSLRSVVESKRMYESALTHLERMDWRRKKVRLHVGRGREHYMRGLEDFNLERLRARFGMNAIEVHGDEGLCGSRVRVEVEESSG